MEMPIKPNGCYMIFDSFDYLPNAKRRIIGVFHQLNRVTNEEKKYPYHISLNKSPVHNPFTYSYRNQRYTSFAEEKKILVNRINSNHNIKVMVNEKNSKQKWERKTEIEAQNIYKNTQIQIHKKVKKH